MSSSHTKLARAERERERRAEQEAAEARRERMCTRGLLADAQFSEEQEAFLNRLLDHLERVGAGDMWDV